MTALGAKRIEVEEGLIFQLELWRYKNSVFFLEAFIG